MTEEAVVVYAGETDAKAIYLSRQKKCVCVFENAVRNNSGLREQLVCPAILEGDEIQVLALLIVSLFL